MNVKEEKKGNLNSTALFRGRFCWKCHHPLTLLCHTHALLWHREGVLNSCNPARQLYLIPLFVIRLDAVHMYYKCALSRARARARSLALARSLSAVCDVNTWTIRMHVGPLPIAFLPCFN